MADVAAAAHALYARLGFIVTSAEMSAYKNEKGEWKKKFKFQNDWQLKTSKRYNKRESGFALHMGPISGCTGIDVDDPEKEANKRLMVLMESCNLISKTKHGFHYVFAYDARILQTADTNNKLDTRNDRGCLFVAPSVAYDDTGCTVAEYKWIRTPAPGEGLVALPDAVVYFLRELDSGYVAGAPRRAARAKAPVTEARRGTEAGAEAAVVTTQLDGQGALKAAALRDAVARAGTERVGVPGKTSLVSETGEHDVVRIVFTCAGTRVCPISRNDHDSHKFNVILKHDEQTGLAALFLFCFSSQDGCKAAGHQALTFLCADEADAFCAEAGLRVPACPALTATLGQSVACIGEAQKHLDRLIENPNGKWNTLEKTSVIACALRTAAGSHATLRCVAEQMLDALLDATRLTETERGFVKRAFQPAKATLDPVAVLRALAAGLNGKREQELMLIREAIVACTDADKEADVVAAAESMMRVLEFCEVRDECSGKIERVGNISELGMFVFHIWRRFVRYGFDPSQGSDAHQWTLYLFNGATYTRGQWDRIAIRAEEHINAVVKLLLDSPSLRARAGSVSIRCQSTDFVARALGKTQMSLKNNERLESCGLVDPEEFEHEMNMGNYIGFKNGVYDILNDRFMPKGSVSLNVLVSMTTRYNYVAPEDPRFPEMRAQIEEFYRTLHAERYDDPDDERLAAMWLLSGSLLFRGNVCKKAYVFLGSEGDNGKSSFTELLQMTLGQYAVTGNRRSLSGVHDQDTLDPELVANHKSLVCVFPEVQSTEGGVSCGFKFNCSKLKLLTGEDPQAARALFCDKKEFIIGFKPILHSNFMPIVDSDDSAARGRLWVARFASTFPPDVTVRDIGRRIFPRMANLRGTMRAWAPYHFLLMLEALRDFRRRDNKLPRGAQQIEGSIMHQAVEQQKPEGKLRAWVEENYARVPFREKDTGTKLETLYGAYTSVVPPIHAKLLGKIKFGSMLNDVFPNIGPHKNAASTVSGLYLLR
jgi:hypothetical protein